MVMLYGVVEVLNFLVFNVERLIYSNSPVDGDVMYINLSLSANCASLVIFFYQLFNGL
ncbi:MAG: hypothetical protein ACI87N_001364 [Flavobacteriales bacterium]|jgi:hypothetical protein